MTTASEISTGLRGAFVLARLDPGGMAYFDRSAAGFVRSYRAAIIIYPVFLLMLALPGGGDADTPSVDGFRIFLVETIGYVIGWTAFPVLMLPLSRFLGREERWLGYIIAYNWAQIPQQLLALASTLLVAGGLLPAPPVFAVTIVAVLVYGAFIARVALDVSRTVATMIVLLDFTLGIFLSQVFQALH
jgi:hypothetical protein